MDFLMNAYRDIHSSEDESSSDSDSSDGFTPTATPIPTLDEGPHDGENSDSEDKDTEGKEKERTFGRTQMLADLGIYDLPPIEDLTISVPERECIPIGNIHNIIDMLVIVAAKKGCPAIDLDSVLFLDQGKKMLGKVLDVFGPVSEPMYMVRFNSAEDVAEKGVEIGMEVFFAPRTKHTAYVFLEPLFQQRGSDASWENDQEPPEHCLDYSDDEEERKAKAALKNKKRKGPEPDSEQATNCNKKFQPRTQQNTRGRGRHQQQRGGHHNQRRQPPNPFYMSLSNKYAGGQQAISASASNNGEQACEATASDVATENLQPDAAQAVEASGSRHLDGPSISSIPDSNDLATFGEKSSHQTDSSCPRIEASVESHSLDLSKIKKESGIATIENKSTRSENLDVNTEANQATARELKKEISESLLVNSVESVTSHATSPE